MADVRYLDVADRFISRLEPRFKAAIMADVEIVAQMGMRAPVSVKTITGSSPLCEIRNGQYRTFFFFDSGAMWIVAACKKQDQKRTIEIANKRMREIRGR